MESIIRNVKLWTGVLESGDAVPGSDRYGQTTVHYFDPQSRDCRYHSPRAQSVRVSEVLGSATWYMDPWSYAIPDECARALRSKFAAAGIGNDGNCLPRCNVKGCTRPAIRNDGYADCAIHEHGTDDER